MLVVCKENNKCDFYDTCEHSKPHNYNHDCSFKNARCAESCVCSEEYITVYERKMKLKKINEKSTL